MRADRHVDMHAYINRQTDIHTILCTPDGEVITFNFIARPLVVSEPVYLRSDEVGFVCALCRVL